MKKIVTAIGNIKLNQKLKEKSNIEVIGTDIQYQEGILELLENENNIDFLIISENIEGGLNNVQLIEKIQLINKNIKIIFILEKQNEEIENILLAKGIYKIMYHNQTEIKDIIYCIEKNNNENEELKKEIDNLKKLILENNQKEEKQVIKIKKEILNKKEIINLENNKIKNIIKNKIIKIIPKQLIKEKKCLKKLKYNQTNSNQKEIISIIGPSGVGKSIISVNLAKSLIYEKEKILLIDFDILNNSLHTILGVKKYPQKIEKEIKENKIENVNNYKIDDLNVEKYILKINKKIDLISITTLLFETKEKLNFFKIEKILNKLTEKYNTIIIDTSSECFFDITKNIIKLSNKSIFVTETNILEIKKSKELLNIYINEWKINKNKINILFNKYDAECINFNLLTCIFSEFNIIGVLKYNAKYNRLINKNIKNNFYDKKIRNEYINLNTNI